ncbi:transcriptional coactivator/pterin dehydratase [Tothia fuscella]|uniref:4a-hydroxytetrahydrobiopterin dehydratase n=1 Tax=Tothia fuscella TaxID=1048955 RepID=A0A9P4U0F5_9PEZI|nr:transcriptional coactivator/pterin dehydratase [Tothia fuscella]
MATQTPTPKWASNTKDNDPEALNNSLSQLLAPNGSWTLIPSGEGIQRVIRFKTFKNAWSFMSSTADEMKKIRHHAEWSNTYNTVFVRWTTHSPKGLSHLDIRMAEVTDRIARECQEVKGDDGGDAAGATRLAGLVDDVERGAGDCCVPKKKIAQS